MTPTTTAPGAAAAADIRDIRGPVAIPSPWLVPLAIAGAALALALLAFLGVRWWRRRPRSGPPAPTPEELALERLEAARRWMDPATSREFGAAVSAAVRLYIEDRFGRRAPRRTTEEFLRELLETSDPALAAHRERLGEFLAHCDLAKFARQPLGPGEMQALLAAARRFVEQTRRPPASGAAAA